MARTPEYHIKDDIKGLLKARGCYIDSRTSKGYGRRGIPDLTGCYRGYYFAIEAKELDTMQPAAWQAKEARNIQKAGGFFACVGAPTHLDRVATLLDAIDVLAGAAV
jgi:hypothetical protein